MASFDQKLTGPENVKADYKAYLQDVLGNY